jgi:hypothetical protein
MAASHLAALTPILAAGELGQIRSMFADATITAVYVRTESDVYGFGESSTTLVDISPGRRSGTDTRSDRFSTLLPSCDGPCSPREAGRRVRSAGCTPYDQRGSG